MHLDLRERWQPLFPFLFAEAIAAGLWRQIDGVNSQTDQTIAEKHRAEGLRKPRRAVRSVGLGSAPIAPHSAQYNELACAEFLRLSASQTDVGGKTPLFLRVQPIGLAGPRIAEYFVGWN